MLTHLYIKNLALIDELEVDFHEGFSVVTGETGAGKSIILGALGLLLGNRADVKAIKDGGTRCTVEAHFDVGPYGIRKFFEDNDIDYSDDCIFRREINANGKSRAFINDTPVSLSQMKELGDRLVDIHSQHQNLLLKSGDFQLAAVDSIAGSQDLLAAYRESFRRLCDAKTRLESTRKKLEQDRYNADFLRFQYEELSALQLTSGEEEQLENQSNAMQHSEDIKGALFETDDNLGNEDTGVVVRLHRSIAAIDGIAQFHPKAGEVGQRLGAAYVELKDLYSEISDMLGSVDYDPAELERVNARLDAIYTMEKKHRVRSVDELLAIQEQLKAEIDALDNSEMTLNELEKATEASRKEATELAGRLSEQRRKAAATMQKEMSRRLKPLGLPGVRFEVELSRKPLESDGADRVEFLFSANPGMEPRPVSQIASGGEVARVMLSLKAMICGVVKLPTIIFDEIDTGVSGRVAEQMAAVMKGMSENSQVVSITHLPQIAAAGSHHYKVYKRQQADNTTTNIKPLGTDERITEIAQMLSGSNVSEAAVENAKQLIGI